MRISTPDRHNENETLNTFSMSYEIASNIPIVTPFETHGFSLGFDQCEHPGFSETIRPENDDNCEFYDPTPDRPMDAARFLSHLHLDSIVRRLAPLYQDLSHFHYPIDAMLRAIIYQRLLGLRCMTQLESKLHNSIGDHIPRNLGFNQKHDGSYAVPDRRTIDHFIWSRLGKDGISLALDAMVIELRKSLSLKGIWLGRRVAVDSTPIEAMYSDKKADYNGYYECNMYKIHHIVCMDTGLSLAKMVTKANAYDGDYLIPLLRKVQSLGIRVEEVIGDQHYGTLENWALLNKEFNIRPYFNLKGTDSWRYDGAAEKIRKRYNSLWQEPGYDPNADMDYMLEFLMSLGFVAQVGAYFRNQWMDLKEQDPHRWQEIYNQRTTVERFNSHVKEQLGLEKNVCVKGIKRIEVYTTLFWITEIACALTRVQNGVTEALLKANQRELF